MCAELDCMELVHWLQWRAFTGIHLCLYIKGQESEVLACVLLMTCEGISVAFVKQELLKAVDRQLPT